MALREASAARYAERHAEAIVAAWEAGKRYQFPAGGQEVAVADSQIARAWLCGLWPREIRMPLV